MRVKVYPTSLVQRKLLLNLGLQGAVTCFGAVNCTDFHCAERISFIFQLLNCSKQAVVQSFDFKGEQLKKIKSLVSQETKQRTTGSQKQK